MMPGIDRVYVNERARNELGWRPRYDFRFIVSERLRAGEDMRSQLARVVAKGYHSEVFDEGPYPVEAR